MYHKARKHSTDSGARFLLQMTSSRGRTYGREGLPGADRSMLLAGRRPVPQRPTSTVRTPTA
eukprot:12492-Eustigmatos_ZCMA.PRE.1